jgi:putative acetyltransferase
MEVTIRTFEHGDEAAFRDLNESWICEHFRMDEKDMRILGDPRTHVLKEGGEIFLIVQRGTTLGCCALLPLADQSWEIAKMAVKNSHRGQGLGRRLLSHVIERAKAVGARKLCLKTSSILQPAISLYTSFGFQTVAPEASELVPNERANVFMELTL